MSPCPPPQGQPGVRWGGGAMALLLLASPTLAVAGKGDVAAPTLASGERRTALGWTLDGRYLVVELDESVVDVKEEQTEDQERRYERARSDGICTDYRARSVEIVDVDTRRTVLRFSRAFQGRDCTPPAFYRDLRPAAEFAQWRRQHPWRRSPGPGAPGGRLQVAVTAQKPSRGGWRGGRFAWAIPDPYAGGGPIVFSLRRADRTVAPRVLAVEPVGGSGEVAVIWSPDQRHLALLASEREDQSHHGRRRIHHESRLFLLPTLGAEAALPVDEPEAAAKTPAQGDLDATTSPRK